MLKIQNPVTISATRKRQAGDGIFSWKRIPRSGLNTLARGVRKLQTASGQVSGFCIVTSPSDDLHSGATARDSHPLPFSSRSTRDTQDAFKRTDVRLKTHVTTRACRSQKCSRRWERGRAGSPRGQPAWGARPVRTTNEVRSCALSNISHNLGQEPFALRAPADGTSALPAMR
jgi:hypothetical protein